jgi:hypothetical protein
MDNTRHTCAVPRNALLLLNRQLPTSLAVASGTMSSISALIARRHHKPGWQSNVAAA